MFGRKRPGGSGGKATLSRRAGIFIGSLAVVLTTGLTGTTTASAAGYYEALFPAGETYRISQGPGGSYSHLDYYNRYAWDIALPANYEVTATQAGTIVRSDWYGTSGIEVMIRHPNGLCSHYIHLNRSFYEPGDWVPQGRIVGWSGSTGSSTAPHLHYGVIDCNTRQSLPSTLEGWTPGTGALLTSSNYKA
ncbi:MULTISPECIES: M23 family metallopeptidase [unclassified Knoellia]|uniref:M23 family metallopeptidase n=1 Tax=Knoellia altitudinis TaxID=3404795 RepID=UPI0036229627